MSIMVKQINSFPTWKEHKKEILKDREYVKMLLENEVEEFNRTEDPTYLIKAIEDSLKYSDLCITDIQRATKLSRQTIYNIINKKNIPQFSTIQKLLNNFGYKILIKKIKPTKVTSLRKIA